MRKLALSAVLAVLLLPTLASAQVSLGLRLGYAFSMGDVWEDADLSDGIGAQIPIQLDVGYRLTPALTLGGYFSYGFGRPGDETEDICDIDGVDCSLRVYRVGVQLDYTFWRASAAPWIGAGLGYEWASFEAENDFNQEKLAVRGFEYLNLQGGIDWKLGSKFSMGPFAMITFGQYGNAVLEENDVEIPGSGTIDDKAFHQWFQIGVRGRFDL